MSQRVTLSTVIDADVKKAVVSFCQRRGIKIQHLIEQALLEQLEDEIDIEAYHERKNEELIPMTEVLKKKRRCRTPKRS